MAEKEDIAELSLAIWREKIDRARRTPPAEKLIDGIELFNWACSVTAAGIRHQHPNWTDEQVRHEIDRRFAMAARRNNHPERTV